MKIGYLMQADAVDMSKVSGPQLHVNAVINGLKHHGHQVRIVAIQEGQIVGSDDMASWFLIKCGFSNTLFFKVIESILRGIQSRLHIPFVRLFDSYHFSDACVSALKGYDVLYERYGLISYGGMIAAKRLRIPIVLEINGDLVEEYHQLSIKLSQLQWKMIGMITTMTLKRTDHLIAVGETIKRIYIHRFHIDPANISVVTNGVDIENFIKTSETAGVRLRYSINNGSVIIFVGSFQPWHGVDYLLEAFANLASIKTNATLVLVGDGPFRSDIQRKSSTLNLENRIVFTGAVDNKEVAALLNIADIAVIYHRGSAADIVETPLKLYEYMAAGKAIVAPAVPNMKRVLSHRITGVLVPPDDPKALTNALVELMEDHQLCDSLGQAARNEAIKKHSWDRAVSEIETILYKVVNKEVQI